MFLALQVSITPSSKRMFSRTDISSTIGSAEEDCTRLCYSQPGPGFTQHLDEGKIESVKDDDCVDKIYGFSQPAHIDDLLLNSQFHFTQVPSLTSYQKLIRRMTRFFVSLDFENAINKIIEVLESLTCSWKRGPSCVITFTTIDRRKNNLIFKANIIEMSGMVLLDFRLSRGCGLEFKRLFIKAKQKLGDLIIKGPATWSACLATEFVP